MCNAPISIRTKEEENAVVIYLLFPEDDNRKVIIVDETGADFWQRSPDRSERYSPPRKYPFKIDGVEGVNKPL